MVQLIRAHPLVVFGTAETRNPNLARFCVRVGTDQHAVHDAEERRVRADPESQGQERHGGEAGVFEQLAEGEAKVVHFRIYDLRFTRWQIQNPKHQAPEKSPFQNSQCPSTKLQAIPKSQIPNTRRAAGFAAWEFELLWDLDVGHWTFHLWFVKSVKSADHGV